MLENDYLSQLRELLQSTACEVELPEHWSEFFEQRGAVPSQVGDNRKFQRLKAPTRSLMWFEQWLPFRDWTQKPMLVFTKDISLQGTGFLSSMEIYPEEVVRLLLPTFWIQLRVVRARRIDKQCYEIGGQLVGNHEPSLQAFELASPSLPVAPEGDLESLKVKGP